ncbi:hypothetical protein B0H10DRAFT_1915927 [Mycena sp. CBHHK59/15]|nr:hypothetical protein B0H10DRAFT_1933395 [Mycena sp. CBHHK59/15]KAJ6615538.1 hypothetical protein B0H10DRAFT_1915927 [Mycena sp. CBHHK59/15]
MPPQEAGTGAAQPFQREVVPKEGHQTRRRNRFADAYRHGLDGAQAAWAARKYKGHRVLPPDFLKDLEAAGIGRGGNVNAGL